MISEALAFVKSLDFDNKLAFYAIPIAVLLLLFIIFKSFVAIPGEKQRFLFLKRLLLLISRLLIVGLLLLAIAAPYTLREKIEKGDPRLTILFDNSSSMAPYDLSFINNLKMELSKEIAVKVDVIGQGSKSEIADGILRNLNTRSLLLVSDANNYKGSDMDDAILFASNSNTSISAINLKAKASEASVSIDGPSETIEGIDNNFVIRINKVNMGSVHLTVKVDDQAALDKTTSDDVVLTKQLSVGTHKMAAQIEANDIFGENNIFYKTITVYEKPKLLLVASEDSTLQNSLSKLYNINRVDTLPEKLSDYLVAIVDDVPASTFSNKDVDALYDYLNDGNGLVVFGGKHSFEYGSYFQSYFESLLPVKTGSAEKKQSDEVNVVLLIDTSGSLDFYGLIGNYSGTDIAKAYALDIIRKMKPSNKVAVIAFNEKPYVVTELVPAANTVEIQKKIESIQNCGKTCGTLFHDTFKLSIDMLNKAGGSKNIIIASDGQAQDFYKSLPLIKQARANGIVTYGINIAEPGSVWGNMEEVAKTGGGQYFRPTEAESISLIFGKGEQKEDAMKGLMIRHSDHFITNNLELNAMISGFNQIVPKTTAIELISTIYADPLLVIGRIGLGRTAVIATDSGKVWAGNLFDQTNSKMVARTINWAIGNPNKNKASYVTLKDAFLGQDVVMIVKSDSVPKSDQLAFQKIDDSTYKAVFKAEKQGFNQILGRDYAVNYDQELQGIGMNPAIDKMTKATRGKMFAPDDYKGIIEKTKLNSIMLTNEKVYYSFYLIIAALALLLLDITTRRIGVYLKK
jgi:Mg-chelatase subunit ChlD